MSKIETKIVTDGNIEYYATFFFNNNTVNVIDGNGVTQTYYASEGKEGFTWRDFDGQFGVRKTCGTWRDFTERLDATVS